MGQALDYLATRLSPLGVLSPFGLLVSYGVRVKGPQIWIFN